MMDDVQLVFATGRQRNQRIDEIDADKGDSGEKERNVSGALVLQSSRTME